MAIPAALLSNCLRRKREAPHRARKKYCRGSSLRSVKGTDQISALRIGARRSSFRKERPALLFNARLWVDALDATKGMSPYQDEPDVHHIGIGGAGHEQVPGLLQEMVGVIIIQEIL